MAKSPAERKQEERARKLLHLISVGAEEMQFVLFGGTRAALEYLKDAGQIEQDREAITFLIHNAEQITKRDMSRINELLKVPCHKKESFDANSNL